MELSEWLLPVISGEWFEVDVVKAHESRPIDYKTLVSKMGGDNGDSLGSVTKITRDIRLKGLYNRHDYRMYTSRNIQKGSIIWVEYNNGELEGDASEIIEMYYGKRHKVRKVGILENSEATGGMLFKFFDKLNILYGRTGRNNSKEV